MIRPAVVSILVVVALGYFIRRVVFLLKLLTIGKKDRRIQPLGKRIWEMFRLSILQGSQFRVRSSDYAYAGVMHIFIIFGFLILLPGEIEFVAGGIMPGFSFHYLGDGLFGAFLFSQDIFIILVILAMVMALFRRLVLRPKQINYHLTSYVILGCICLLMLTLFGTNALRMVDPGEVHFSMAGAKWMPVTNFFVNWAGLSGPYPLTIETLWWLHLLVFLFFLDYIPNSKHLHVFAAIPANLFRNLAPPLVRLSKIDFEAEELSSLGVSKIEDMTWKQLYDGYSCTECGRCTDQCPANNTGKELSPREVILGIKENLLANGPRLLERPREDWGEMERVKLIGDSISENGLWQCTTCVACANVCPVGNEHLRDVVEMRRYLMMEEGNTTDLMAKAIKSLEARRHPFFGTGSGPKDWRKGLDLPFFEPGEAEYLLWIGCSTIYEERAQKIARETARILKTAGVSFGILKETRCTGDPAKQMGNEFLFNELAQENISEFSELGVNKIITLCPHCYNSFKHHYPELGGCYEVVPHSVLISDLVMSGKLVLGKGSESITFHDPCYLARHNGVVDAPRELIGKMGDLVEMPRHGKAGFCCGGGGGNYWAEEEGTRINQMRSEEAFKTGAVKIATACPFCLLMMTDGLKKFTDEQRVYDIAELVGASLSVQ